MTTTQHSDEADLVDTVVDAVHQHASRIARDVEQEVLRPLRLSYRDWRVLHYLAAHPRAHPGEVATTMCAPKASLSGVIDRLQGRGLMRREPDESDHRRTRLVLTDEGSRVVERWGQAVAEVEERRYAALTEHTLRFLAEALADDAAGVATPTRAREAS